MAKELAHSLSEQLGTRVEIGAIKIDLFNTASIDSITIWDQSGKKMLFFDKVVSSFELLPLLKGEICITNLKVIKGNASLYKTTSKDIPNWQFLVDSLFPSDSQKEQKWTVNIQSVVLRDLSLKYDVYNKPQSGGVLDLNHLDLDNINSSIVVSHDKGKNSEFRVRNMSLRQSNGNEITQLRAIVNYKKDGHYNVDIKELAFNVPSFDTKFRLHNSQLAIVPAKADNLWQQIKHANLMLDINVGSKKYNSEIRVSEPGHLSVSINENGRSLFDGRASYAETPLKTAVIDFAANINKSDILTILTALGQPKPEDGFFVGLETVNQQGHLDFDNEKIVFTGTTASNFGTFSEKIHAIDNAAMFEINIADLKLMPVSDNRDEVRINDASINGNLALNYKQFKDILRLPLSQIYKNTHGTAKAKINHIAYNDNALSDVDVVAELTNGVANIRFAANDPNAHLELKGKLESLSESTNLSAQLFVHRLHCGQFGIGGDFVPANMIGQADINIYNVPGQSSKCDIAFKDLHITDKEGNNTKIGDVIFSCQQHGADKIYSLESDAISGEMHTNLDIGQIKPAIIEQLSTYLPSLRKTINNQTSSGNGFCNFDVQINNASLLSDYLNDDVALGKPVAITGQLSRRNGRMSFTLSAPEITVGSSRYEGVSAFLNNGSDSLRASVMLTKYFGNVPVRFENHATANSDKIYSQFLWRDRVNSNTGGSLNTTTTLHHNANSQLALDVHILPTNLYITDSLWQISPAVIQYSSEGFSVNNFSLSRNNQHMSINADFTKGKQDAQIELKDIEIAYLIGLTNLRAVEFGGKASGQIWNSAQSGKTTMLSDLTVDDFTFNGANLGRLNATSSFDIAESRLIFNAKAQATDQDSTLIIGDVRTKDKKLDINIESEKTNLQFLNKYIGKFTEDLEGNTTGKFHLYGTFKYVQMEAEELINYMKFRPKLLGALYTIENQNLHIKPDTIDLSNLVVCDQYGNKAHVNGSVNHNKMFNFNYDINFMLDNMLTINWSENIARQCWGRVFTTGQLDLSGNLRDVAITGELSTTRDNEGSVLYYNSEILGRGEENRDYIHFTPMSDPSSATLVSNTLPTPQKTLNTGTNVRLNIKLNSTPDATLNIITDPITHDQMALHGEGPLQISYYNKGKFEINGLYSVNSGNYKLTIKDIIHRSFDIQPGGHLRFNGPLSDAEINLKGIHRVNSVSLSDLNVGASHSNSTVGADCILNFTGKAAEPKVSFDLDFPKANDQERQLLKKYILTEEDRNMQAVYLLSIGRFYTYNQNNFSSTTGSQNQSTVALTSFLAGTLSGQINNMLQDAFHITNWNFGTNIAAGRMGFNDMEVQGSLSGKMFNNRLLINGSLGYRDQITTYSNNIVGDFNLQWLLNKAGTISLKAYSETNDRYFTKSSLTTQGGGILFKKDFKRLRDFFKK